MSTGIVHLVFSGIISKAIFQGGMLMIEVFQISGMLAGILMTVAGFTGFFGPGLRKKIKGPLVFAVHRWCGIGAVVCGLTHGLIYILYLG